MLTVYGLGTIPQSVIGYNRDLRVEWALEELGIAYQFYGLNFREGEQRSSEFCRISPFQLVPAILDDGFSVAESGAILIYLAEKNGKLIPADFHGRIHVIQWCFSILNTIEKKMQDILTIRPDKIDEKSIFETKAKAARWLNIIEAQLENKQWIANQEFTIADILLATVLRGVHSSGVIDDYPRIKDYMNRAFERQAWQNAIATYSKRTGRSVAELQIARDRF